MIKITSAAIAALIATGAFAQTTNQSSDTPPANPGNMPATTTGEGSSPMAAPDTGMSGTPMTETRMKTDLAASGYTDVRDFAKDGTGWKGTAMHQGKRVPIRLGQDGKIANQPM